MSSLESKKLRFIKESAFDEAEKFYTEKIGVDDFDKEIDDFKERMLKEYRLDKLSQIGRFVGKQRPFYRLIEVPGKKRLEKMEKALDDAYANGKISEEVYNRKKSQLEILMKVAPPTAYATFAVDSEKRLVPIVNIGEDILEDMASKIGNRKPSKKIKKMVRTFIEAHEALHLYKGDILFGRNKIVEKYKFINQKLSNIGFDLFINEHLFNTDPSTRPPIEPTGLICSKTFPDSLADAVTMAQVIYSAGSNNSEVEINGVNPAEMLKKANLTGDFKKDFKEVIDLAKAYGKEEPESILDIPYLIADLAYENGFLPEEDEDKVWSVINKIMSLLPPDERKKAGEDSETLDEHQPGQEGGEPQQPNPLDDGEITEEVDEKTEDKAQDRYKEKIEEGLPDIIRSSKRASKGWSTSDIKKMLEKYKDFLTDKFLTKVKEFMVTAPEEKLRLAPTNLPVLLGRDDNEPPFPKGVRLTEDKPNILFVIFDESWSVGDKELSFYKSMVGNICDKDPNLKLIAVSTSSFNSPKDAKVIAVNKDNLDKLFYRYSGGATEGFHRILTNFPKFIKEKGKELDDELKDIGLKKEDLIKAFEEGRIGAIIFTDTEIYDTLPKEEKEFFDKYVAKRGGKPAILWVFGRGKWENIFPGLSKDEFFRYFDTFLVNLPREAFE